MTSATDTLLRGLLSITARQVFPPDKLAEIVGGPKQIDAYNLCDGTRTQGEVAKSLKLDAGNFSRTVGRWIEAGILLRIGESREAKLLHLYPVQVGNSKKGWANEPQ